MTKHDKKLSYVCLSGLANWSCNSLNIAGVVQLQLLMSHRHYQLRNRPTYTWPMWSDEACRATLSFVIVNLPTSIINSSSSLTNRVAESLGPIRILIGAVTFVKCELFVVVVYEVKYCWKCYEIRRSRLRKRRYGMPLTAVLLSW